jgi:hypothetical protein
MRASEVVNSATAFFGSVKIVFFPILNPITKWLFSGPSGLSREEIGYGSFQDNQCVVHGSQIDSLGCAGNRNVTCMRVVYDVSLNGVPHVAAQVGGTHPSRRCSSRTKNHSSAIVHSPLISNSSCHSLIIHHFVISLSIPSSSFIIQHSSLRHVFFYFPAKLTEPLMAQPSTLPL